MACTKSGDPCDFPFSYKDTMYNECTSRDSNKPWCETNAQTDDWGYCAECPSSEYYTIDHYSYHYCCKDTTYTYVWNLKALNTLLITMIHY